MGDGVKQAHGMLPQLPHARRQELWMFPALKAGWYDKEALWYAEWSVRYLMSVMDDVPEFHYDIGFFREVVIFFKHQSPQRVIVVFNDEGMSVHHVWRDHTAEEHKYADPQSLDYRSIASLSRFAQLIADALRS